MKTIEDFDMRANIKFDGSAQARRNWDMAQQHAVAEWSNDLEATMATIHPDNPFQLCYATGMEVWGYEGVKEFYRNRHKVFNGQGFHAHRVIATDEFVAMNGWFKGVAEGKFFLLPAEGRPMFFPITIWIYFKDNLVLGESTFFDSAEVKRQIKEGATGDVRTPIY